MSYHFTKAIDVPFEDAIGKVTEALKKEGFGIITQIDIRDAMKKKLSVEFRKYLILGTCNPHFAHRALEIEDKIGIMLPCNVVLQEKEPGKTEVSVVDPAASMASVKNKRLEEIAGEVRAKLKKIIDDI